MRRGFGVLLAVWSSIRELGSRKYQQRPCCSLVSRLEKYTAARCAAFWRDFGMVSTTDGVSSRRVRVTGR